MGNTLIIGPREGESSIGGIVVLFENFIYSLGDYFEFICVDSNSKNYTSKFLMYFNVFINVLMVHKYSSISLHGTSRDYLFFSPLLLFSKIVLKKKYSLRKFAGHFDVYYKKSSFIKKYLLTQLLKHSESNFFETKALVDYFSILNRETHWFPNVRNSNNNSVSVFKNGRFKLLYISQITTDKGVFEAINAVAQIPDVSLDIYGPLVDVEQKDFDSLPNNVNYHGAIPSTMVSDVMGEYHLLVLPTYYAGEGYPGVIIEAFSMSLPVVSTLWRSIPEMFSDSSCLCEPRNIHSLIEKILLVKDNHSYWVQQSKVEFVNFESIKATQEFIEKSKVFACSNRGLK